MLRGVLLRESLSDLSVLARLNVTKTETWDVPDAADYQPNVWTALSFEVGDADADAIAEELSHALKAPGWYVDARSDEWVYVIFPQRVFKYRRGDGAGRAQAQAHALAVGIPSGQLDWGD